MKPEGIESKKGIAALPLQDRCAHTHHVDSIRGFLVGPFQHLERLPEAETVAKLAALDFGAAQPTNPFDLLDGRVEIIAEGFPQDVDRFIAEVEQIMKSYIEYTTGTDSTATAEYDSFTIEY